MYHVEMNIVFYGINISSNHHELEPHAIYNKSFILYALNNYQSNSR